MATESLLLQKIGKMTDSEKKKAFDHTDMPSSSICCRKCHHGTWLNTDRQLMCLCSHTRMISWASKSITNGHKDGGVETFDCEVYLQHELKEMLGAAENTAEAENRPADKMRTTERQVGAEMR